jgi:hypothetical protein
VLKDKIPKFYFPDGVSVPDNIEAGDKIINEVFTKDLNLSDFERITVDFLGFPKMFNSVLFNKITGGEKKISKKQFLRYKYN